MINRQALVGLIGANIMKSLSPAMHIDTPSQPPETLAIIT